MDYSRFYTPTNIALLLVRQLNIKPPDSIIDICCGSCNLLYSAKKRWKHAELIGVDIISNFPPDINCVHSDGRKFALLNQQRYSLVLGNPPFDTVLATHEFPSLYEGLHSNYTSSRLEVEMLLANLKLLNKNGTLLIIMPSTFVNAERYKKYRTYIAKNYHLQQIISLPAETFGSSCISTYALIIKNQSPEKRRTLCSNISLANGNYQISPKTIQPRKLITEGIWDTSYSHKEIPNTFDFRRGTIASDSFTTNGIPILHTAKCCSDWEPSIRYISSKKENMVYAERGDIVISRIGKSAGSWTVYSGKRIPISDCLFRIKDPFGSIASQLSNHKYSFPLKGVATKYITIQDFLFWYNSLNK